MVFDVDIMDVTADKRQATPDGVKTQIEYRRNKALKISKPYFLIRGFSYLQLYFEYSDRIIQGENPIFSEVVSSIFFELA